jgi:hypothetical protein
MRQASTRESIEFYSGDLNTLVDEKLAPRYRNIWLVTRPRASSGSLWSFFCISTTGYLICYWKRASILVEYADGEAS